MPKWDVCHGEFWLELKEQGADQYLDQKYFDQVSGGNRKELLTLYCNWGPHYRLVGRGYKVR